MPDLTDIARVKEYLRLDNCSDDETALLERLLSAASARIERDTRRTFTSASYRERINGDRNKRFPVKHYPVTDMIRVSSGDAFALSVDYSGSGIRATVSVTETAVVLRSTSTTGTVTTDTLTFADNGSSSAMKTAIDAVSDWSATTNNNVPSLDFNPAGSIDAKGGTAYIRYPDLDLEYSIDWNLGVIGLMDSGAMERCWNPPDAASMSHPATGFQNILVEYVAGYASESIPEDLQQVTVEMVAAMYHYSSTNPNLSGETLDSYSYTLAASTPFDTALKKRVAMWSNIR